MSLRTCASLPAREIIHEGNERGGSGRAGTETLNPTVQGTQSTLRRETGTPAGHLLRNRELISGHVQPSKWRPMISRSSSVEARESTFSGSSEEFTVFGRQAFQISRSRSSRDFFSCRRDPRSRTRSALLVAAMTLCIHVSTSSLTNPLSDRRSAVCAVGRLSPRCRARGVSGLASCSGVISRRCVQRRNDQAVASYRPHTSCLRRNGDSPWRISSRDRRSNEKSGVIPAGTLSMPCIGPRPCRRGRPPKGKEDWESGKLSHRHSAMCAFKLPTAVCSSKLI